MERRRVTVILFPEEEGGYTAFLPLYPSCTTQGETADEALNNAKESLELLMEDPSQDDIEFLDLSHAPHVVVGEVEIEVPARASDSAVGVS